MVAVGTQLGAYVLKKLLGAGGMGRVYLAEHFIMKNRCAVKVLSEELGRRQDVVQRFVNEARAASNIPHRNLIRVVDVGQAENNGPWYMVLDYLEGETLGAFIAAQGGPVSTDLIVRLLCQVANALHELHKHRIIHRDVKADNIFLIVKKTEKRGTDQYFPIVLDLGVASVGAGLSDGPRTLRGAVLGTPCAMAPEQLLGEAVGPEADVYALGVLLYELSTGGWYPYQGDEESHAAYMHLSPAELYRRQVSSPPVDPRRRNPGMGDAWAKVIFSWLEVDRLKRVASTKDAIIELAGAAPTDETDGFQIVEAYAGELLQGDARRETIRTPAATIATSGSSARITFGEKLGAGGMAEVFAGTQIGEQGFERPVALKRVLSDLSAQPAFEAMLITEARLAARLSHPNIVAVQNLQKDQEGRLFVVMERVNGNDLGALLEKGPLPHSTIVHIIVELLRGLAFAHGHLDTVTGTHGIIHRDISPENVMLSKAGEVKINDFGLARAFDAAGRVGSATIRGKPNYMSPEQVRGELLDNRSDLWAVGVMLWEMLARRPMLAGTQSEVMAQVLYKDIPPPKALRKDVPADLQAVAMKLLQRDLKLRYAKAEDAITDLLRCDDAPLNGRDEVASHLAARFAHSDPGASRRGAAGAAMTPRLPVPDRVTSPITSSTLGTAASESTPPQPLPRPRRSHRTVLLVLPVIVGVAAFVGVLAARRHAAHVASAPAVVQHAAVSSAPLAYAAPPPDAAVTGGAPPSLDAAMTIDAGPTNATVPPDSVPPDSAPAAAAPVDAPSSDAPADARRRDAAPPGTDRPGRMVPPPKIAPTPWTTSTAEPGKSGKLVIVVQPWATVWINNKKSGATPFGRELPPGRYAVRLENDDLSKTETIGVTIEPNKTTTLERTW